MVERSEREERWHQSVACNASGSGPRELNQHTLTLPPIQYITNFILMLHSLIPSPRVDALIAKARHFGAPP